MSESVFEKPNLKMVVVCAGKSHAQSIAAGFEGAGFQLAAIGTDAAEAIELVRKHNPDVLIMDPYLAGMNCDELTAYLEQEEKADLVKAVVSDHRQDLLADRFMDSGGDLFRVIPMDFQYTADRLRRYHRLRHSQSRPEETFTKEEAIFQEDVIRILKKIGMPMTMKGYRYIRYGALLVRRHPALLDHLMLGFYAAIAERFESNTMAVERCMRTAIEKACNDGEPDILYNYFNLQSSNGKLQNGEFMLQLLELCRTDLQNIER